MIILTNGLSSTADEGALKIAVSLTRRLRAGRPDTTVITYERRGPESDVHLKLNKLFWNPGLWRMIRKKGEKVLYIPFPTRMLPAAMRIFTLSRFARRGLDTLLVMNGRMDPLAAWLIRASGSRILTVSRQNYEAYRAILGSRAVYLKTGVDTRRFRPARPGEKAALRRKYGLPEDKPIVLHVGHMARGRNIGVLTGLGEKWHIVLAVSTLTAAQRDEALRARLLEMPNLTLMEAYNEHIEELYRLADVYLFPVAEAGHCIDVPLSALEAAASGIPVAATAYGELGQLLGKPGFYPIESFAPDALEGLLTKALREGASPRESILDYDWENTVMDLLREYTVPAKV